MSRKPQARTDRLTVKEMIDETLVYDLETHKAYCLNRTAALVFKHCDGKRSVRGLSRLLTRELEAPQGDELVWLALDRLGRSGLLKRQPAPPPEVAQLTRREVARRLGLAGGMTVLLPVVVSLLAPTAEAAAATCVSSCLGQADGTPCNPPICSNSCSSGLCV